MAHENPLGPITFPVAAATERFRRVKFDGAGKLILAGIADKELGTTEHATFAADDLVAVRPRTIPGVRRMVAAGVVAARAKVYSAANGQVSATAGSTSYEVGIAITASTAALDIISVLTDPGDNAAA